jgi:hypothetical protein
LLAVDWKRPVNAALTRATGYQLSKARPAAGGRRPVRAAAGDRLVEAPAFILSTLRSGSTLLRVLLDSHSQIHAPQELHLRYLDVSIKSKWAVTAMKEIGLDEERLEYLLWDRVLHRELTKSGKRHLVNKTPNDVFIADRIKECWPDSRFIFLLRHPGAIVRSRQNLRPESDDSVETILRYGEALERARQAHPGLTVRYEDVTNDPEAQTRRICEYLGVPWEEGMIDYGRHDHGRYKAGLGDWAGKIRTGQVQPAEPPPPAHEIPAELHALCAAWGYLPAADAPAPAQPVDSSPAA